MDTKVIPTGVRSSSVPESYTWTEADPPRLSEASTCKNVPVVDRGSIVSKTAHACATYGFFQVLPPAGGPIVPASCGGVAVLPQPLAPAPAEPQRESPAKSALDHMHPTDKLPPRPDEHGDIEPPEQGRPWLQKVKKSGKSAAKFVGKMLKRLLVGILVACVTDAAAGDGDD